MDSSSKIKGHIPRSCMTNMESGRLQLRPTACFMPAMPATTSIVLLRSSSRACERSPLRSPFDQARDGDKKRDHPNFSAAQAPCHSLLRARFSHA